jgi:predicted Rossmann fold flavoprotein
MEKKTDILILGGGAAGFFAAISAAKAVPDAKILLLEKGRNFLAKVKVSGGGRCNVTCGEEEPKKLAAFYPRGARMLSRLYFDFGPTQTKEWFIKRGVNLKTEADGRVFPVSNSSQTIIDCLFNELKKSGVTAELGFDAVSAEKVDNKFIVTSRTGETILATRVIVATGGAPKEDGLLWLKEMGHEIVTPLPSLFTFNSPSNPICKLMGVSVPLAHVRIAGTKFEYAGPLLITHWGGEWTGRA